jgi:hypothetical protein
MKKLRYLNPFRIRDAIRDIRRVFGSGGPKLVRVVSVGHPEGWIVPISTVTIEVEGKNGRKERFCPEIPVPFPYAWAWRIARRLGVPLVRSVEPEKLSFEVPVPGRS